MNNSAFMLVAGMAMAVFASGCATAPVEGRQAAEAPPPAVMCSKCAAVWVSTPRQINKTTVYRHEKKMACPDCDSAASTFFKTGRLEHACKTCGDSLVTCPACK